MLSYCFIAFIHLGHRRLKLIQFSMSEDIHSGPELLGIKYISDALLRFDGCQRGHDNLRNTMRIFTLLLTTLIYVLGPHHKPTNQICCRFTNSNFISSVFGIHIVICRN